LFLDEPTAGIDPVLRQTIWSELRILREAGRTLFVTTQYVGEAEDCDQVALLEHGRLVALDTPEGLRRSAIGGEVVEIETRQFVDAGALASVSGVLDIQPTAPRKWLVVTENAGETTPRLVEAVANHNWELVTLREYRPTFDEVFARLLTNGN